MFELGQPLWYVVSHGPTRRWGRGKGEQREERRERVERGKERESEQIEERRERVERRRPEEREDK